MPPRWCAWHSLHLRHDGRAVVRRGVLHRLQIVTNGGVDADLDLRGHRIAAGIESIGEAARRGGDVLEEACEYQIASRRLTVLAGFSATRRLSLRIIP
jgi:hypothetical protein